MMCLGWYTRPQCATRPQVQVTPGTDGTGGGSVTWFWLASAAIVVANVIKGKKSK